MKIILTTLLITLTIVSTSYSKDFNIEDYGAIGDGETLCTQAVQKAIDACTFYGGGRVVVPSAKTYIIGTIYLKSNVTLYLEKNATLKSTLDYDLYTTDTYKTRYKLEKHMSRCLIYAEDAENITIEGHGTIDGNALEEYFHPKNGTGRPMLMRFLRCNNFNVKDVTLINPASWTTDWVFCDNITISGVDVVAQMQHNGAAIALDGCTNVQVTNCNFDTSDDAVAITSSAKDKPSKNMVFSNCTFTGKWSAFRIGLLSLGDFESISVTNCTFTNITDAGFKIQMNEGAELKNMVFSNIVMKNVPRPIFMTFCQQKASVDAPDGMFPMKAMHHFNFNNMIIDNSELDKDANIFITGMPNHYITDIQLSDIQMILPGGGTKEDAEKENINEYTLDVLDGWWPEFKLIGTLPASGIYVRHVNGIYMNNIQIKMAGEDARPPIVLEDVPNYAANEIYLNYKKLKSVVVRK
ncbi:glycoside hydrolase family 28 protein [Polaribacter sp. SA4-12]|uniref:glycoside hydrolase family 28 protein n=1 Tax=Polaribacter sp. SA4-12 TaxID=1312072 RepID=UPI000B3C6C26|nr:glycosyl hydrolase family 28 protein [Polaribacter sp. SA4-12]ARV16549.1 glycoside hydrolase [Polaribacter sp. SA4-12]